MSAPLPIILLAFANDRRPTEGHWLRDLVEERRELADLLEDAQSSGPLAGRFSIHLEPNLTVLDLERCVSRFGPQLIGIHFGGHADPTALRLEDRQGHPAPFAVDALAAAVARCPALKWVFLNGCSTRGHIDVLSAVTDATVIATTSIVQDEVARRFASFVYSGLVTGRSLEEAFSAAESRTLAQRRRRHLHRPDLSPSPETGRMGRRADHRKRAGLPWILSKASDTATWSLTDELGRWGLARHLDDGRRSLPPSPTMESLLRFEHAVVPMHGEGITEIFAELDRWADEPTAVSVRQVTGARWSGKSRLLAEWMATRSDPLIGFAEGPFQDDFLADLDGIGSGVLVIDDAAHHDGVDRVLDKLAERWLAEHGRVRLLLVSEEPDWLSTATGLTDRARRFVATAAPPVTLETTVRLPDRAEAFEHALDELSSHLKTASSTSLRPDLSDACFGAPGWIHVAAAEYLEGHEPTAQTVAHRIARLHHRTEIQLSVAVHEDHWQARMGGFEWRVDHAIARPENDLDRRRIRDAASTVCEGSREELALSEWQIVGSEARQRELGLRQQAAELGRTLTDALLPAGPAGLLARAIEAASGARPAVLTIRARAAASNLAHRVDDALAWPWSLLRSGDTFPVERGALVIKLESVHPNSPDAPSTRKWFRLGAFVAAPLSAPFGLGDPHIGLLRAAADDNALDLCATGSFQGLIDFMAPDRHTVGHISAVVDHRGIWMDSSQRPGQGEAPTVRKMLENLQRPLPETMVLALDRWNTAKAPAASEEMVAFKEGTLDLDRRAPRRLAAELHRRGVPVVILVHGPLHGHRAAEHIRTIHNALASGATPTEAVATAARSAQHSIETAAGNRIHPFAWMNIVLFQRGPDRPVAIPGPSPFARSAPIMVEEPPGSPGPWRPVRSFSGREAERATILSRWSRGERVCFVHGFAGLGKSSLCAEVAPLLMREMGEEARILTVDAESVGVAGMWSALRRHEPDIGVNSGGQEWTTSAKASSERLPLLVHINGLDHWLGGDGCFVDGEVEHLWSSLLDACTSAGNLGLLVSSRITPTRVAGMLRLPSMRAVAIRRMTRWLPTLGRLPDPDADWLASRLHGHPATALAVEAEARRLVRARAKRLSGPDATNAGVSWQAGVLEPALERAMDRVAAGLRMVEQIEGLTDRVRRHLLACAVLEEPVPWGAIVALGDEASATRMTDLSLITPSAGPSSTTISVATWWAPHPYALRAIGPSPDASSHAAVGRWLIEHAPVTGPSRIGRLAIIHLLAAGLADVAWPQVRRRVAWLRESGRLGDAQSLLQGFHDAQPSDENGLIARVFLVQIGLLRKQIPADAEDTLDAATLRLKGADLVFALSTRAFLELQHGRRDSAREYCDRCIELVGDTDDDPTRPSLVRLLTNLGHICATAGDIGAAVSAYARAVSQGRRITAAAHRAEMVDALREQGRMLGWQGRTDDARRLLEEALELSRSVWGTEQHIDVVRCLSALGEHLWRSGLVVAARFVLEQATGLIGEVMGADRDPAAVRCTVALGSLYSSQRDIPAARSMLRRAIALAETQDGPADVQCAEPLYHLAYLEASVGDLEAAEQLLGRAAAIYEGAYGTDAPHVLSVKLARAEFCEKRGDLSTAEILTGQVLAGLERIDSTPAGMQVLIARALYLAGHIATTHGDRPSGRSAWIRCIDVLRLLTPRTRPQSIDHVLGGLAESFKADGRLDDAVIARRDAFDAIVEAEGTDEHLRAATGLLRLAQAQCAAGHPEVARASFERLLLITRRLDGDVRAIEAAAHDDLGRMCTAAGDDAAALDHGRQALTLQLDVLGGEPHPIIATLHHNVGVYALTHGEPAEAAEQFRRAAATRFPDDDLGERARDYAQLGRALIALGDLEDAVDAFEEASRLSGGEAEPPVHRAVGVDADLAGVLLDLGRSASALSRVEAALGRHAPGTHEHARLLYMLSLSQRRQLDSRAGETLRRALEAYEALDEPGLVVNRATVRLEFARHRITHGDLDAARHQLDLAQTELSMSQSVTGLDTLVTALYTAGRLELADGNHQAAVSILRRAFDGTKELSGHHAADRTINILMMLALALNNVGESDEALATAERAVTLAVAGAGREGDMTVVKAPEVLADLKVAGGDAAGAVLILERAQAALAQVPMDEEPARRGLERASLDLTLADILAGSGRLDEARRQLEGTLAEVNDLLAADHAMLTAIKRSLRRVRFGLSGPDAPPGSLAAAADALSAGDLIHARTLLEPLPALLAGTPNEAVARAMLGTLLASRGETAEVQNILEAVDKPVPED